MPVWVTALFTEDQANRCCDRKQQLPRPKRGHPSGDPRLLLSARHLDSGDCARRNPEGRVTLWAYTVESPDRESETESVSVSGSVS